MSLPSKVDLSALHRLQFYRNKKDWKLCSEVHSDADDVKKKVDDAQEERPSTFSSSAANPDTITDKYLEESEFKTSENSLYSRSKTYINSSTKTGNTSSDKTSLEPSVIIKKSRIGHRSRKTKILASKQKHLSTKNKTNSDAINNERNSKEKNFMKSNENIAAKGDNDTDINIVKDTASNINVVISRNNCFKVIIPAVEIDEKTQKAQRVKNDKDINTKDTKRNKENSQIALERKVNDKNFKDAEFNRKSSRNVSAKIDNSKDLVDINNKRRSSKKSRGRKTSVSQNLLKSFDKRTQTSDHGDIKREISEDTKYLDISQEIVKENEAKGSIPIKEKDISTDKSKLHDNYSNLPVEIDKGISTDLPQDDNKGKDNDGIMPKEPVRTHNLPIYAKLSQDEMMFEELFEAHNKIQRRLKKNLDEQNIATDVNRSDTDMQEIASRLAKMEIKMQKQSQNACKRQSVEFDENAMFEQEFATGGCEGWNNDEICSSEHKERDVNMGRRQEQEWNCGRRSQWNDQIPEESSRPQSQIATHWTQNWTNAGEEAFFNQGPYDPHFEEYPTRDVGLDGHHHTPPIDIGQGLRRVPSSHVFDPRRRHSGVPEGWLDQSGPPVFVPSFDPHSEPNFSPIPQSNNAHGPLSRKSMSSFESRYVTQSFVPSQSFDPQTGAPSTPPPPNNHNRPYDQMSFDPRRGSQELSFGPQCDFQNCQQIPSFNDQNHTMRSSTPLDDSCYGSASFMQSSYYGPHGGPPTVPPPSPEHYEAEFVPTMSSFRPSSFDSRRDSASMLQIPPFDPHRPPPNYPLAPIDKHGPPHLVSSSSMNESRREYFNSLCQPLIDPLCGHDSISPVPFDPKNGPLGTPSLSVDPQHQNVKENESQKFNLTDCNENLNVQGNSNRNDKGVKNKNNLNKNGKNENKLLKFIQDFNNKFINEEKEKGLIENNILKKSLNKQNVSGHNYNNDHFYNKNTVFEKESTSYGNKNLETANFSHAKESIPNRTDNYFLKDMSTAKEYLTPDDASSINNSVNHNQIREQTNNRNNYMKDTAQRQINPNYESKEQFVKNPNLCSPNDVPVSNNNQNYEVKPDNKSSYYLQEDKPTEIDITTQKDLPTRSNNQKETFANSGDYTNVARTKVQIAQFNYVSAQHMTVPNTANFDCETSKDQRYLAQKEIHVVTNTYVAQNVLPMANDHYYDAQSDIPSNYINNTNEQTDTNTRYNYQPNFIQNINIIAQNNVSNNIQGQVEPVVVASYVRSGQIGVVTEGGRGRGRLKTEARNLGPQQFY